MQSSRKSWTQDLIALTLFFALLFGAFLGSRPLMAPDEGRYAEIPREMALNGDYLTPHLNGVKFFEKPPLFYWLETVPIRWFGTNEWSLRSTNALLGLIGCLIVYCGVRKLYDRRTGLLASLVLSTSTLYAILAHIITPDLLLTVLLTSTLLAFMLGADQPPGRGRRKYLWSMYALAALATLAKGLVGIIFPAVIIFVWLGVTHRWRDLKTYCIPTGLLLFAAIAIPWHWLVQQQNPEFFNFYFITQQFSRYLTTSAHREAPFWFIPVSVLSGFFPWVCFLLAMPLAAIRPGKQRSLSPHPLLQSPYKDKTYFLVIWALVILLFFCFSKSKLLTYTLPILPPLAILMGGYLAAYWHKKPPFAISLGFSLAACLGVGMAIVGLIAARPHFPVFWYISIALLVLSTGCSLAIYLWKGLAAGFIALIFTFGACLISFNLSYSAIDQRSVKSIALILKPQLDADASAIMVNYRDYHQDLPVYLQRQILVVSPQGELEFGSQHQNANWIVDEKDFWQRWNHGPKMFMMLTEKLYQSILNRQRLAPGYQTPFMLVLIKQNNLLVVTNIPMD